MQGEQLPGLKKPTLFLVGCIGFCPSRVKCNTGYWIVYHVSRRLYIGGTYVATELVLLEDESFENLDGCATAYVLAAGIKKTGEYGPIFTGRMAADTNSGQVGSGIAEILAVPSGYCS